MDDKKGKQVEKTVEKNTELCNKITQKFNDAVMSKSNDTAHYENGLTKEIELCHMARRGILDDDEKIVAEELSKIGLEFGKRKAYTALNLMYELVRDSIDKPILAPTEEPEINDDSIVEIVNNIKTEIFVNRDPLAEVPTSVELDSLGETLTLQYKGEKKDIAARGVSKAELRIRDKIQDSDYRTVNREILDDFVSMPFCVGKYPSNEYEEVSEWKKNKWVQTMKIVPRLKRVSPFDFFILNGTTPKNAEAVFEIRNTLRHSLYQMKGEKGWDSDAIDKVVGDKDGEYSYSASNSSYFLGTSNRENKEFYSYLSHKNNNLTLLETHITMRGEDIKGSAINGESKVDDSKFYEVVIVSCGKLVVYSNIIPDSEPIKRPYYVTSYERLNGTWSGVGILQRVRRAEKIARSFLYAAIRNASRSAEPAGEINFERVKHFYGESTEEVMKQKGGMFLVESDPTGTAGGSRAVNYYDIPNNTAQFISALQFFMELIDLLSDVPKLSSGDMSGMATLGRSYRGIAMVQQAESKSIRAALDNFDMYLQEPIFYRMYADLMIETKDPEIRTGDANIVARGTSGYLRKEFDAAARQETLTQMGDRLAAVSPELMRDMTIQVLRDQGVDVDKYISQMGMEQTGAAPTDVGSETGIARVETPAFGGQTVPV